jgi:hypothetical protein
LDKGDALRFTSEVDGAQSSFLAKPQAPITRPVGEPPIWLDVSISPQGGEIVVPQFKRRQRRK